jgi:hypothetical protein
VGRKRLTRAVLSMAASVNCRGSSVMGVTRGCGADGWVVEQAGARAEPEVAVA